MAFISVADELTKKSATHVENKFITKYLAELEPVAVKVYLYAVYLYQNGKTAYSLEDFAKKMQLDEDKVKEYFEYLDEMELVAITSKIPFEVKILDCDNYDGKPKKLHPEKYDGLYDEIQAIITERMVSQNEFREYLILLEDYEIERNALIMIVNYCVSFTNDKAIRWQYIKKVAKNFSADGVTTYEQVSKRLADYNASTPFLYNLFKALSIKRSPEIDDSALVEKWQSRGFNEDAVICAAKGFKTKSLDRLDLIMEELYKNNKFDAKEIDDYRKEKNSLYETAKAIGKSLSVYIPDPAPYVENYISVWCGYGFSSDALKKIANYCFLSGKNSFDSMNDFISKLYDDAFVDDNSVTRLLEELAEDDAFIKTILTACGLTRKIIPYDRQALARWRGWNFNEAMILKAAELSAGKNNPVAAMNYLLSSWKNSGIYTVEQIPENGFKSDSGKKTFKATQREKSLDILKKLFNEADGD